jgi:hypothetical protein
MSDGGLTEAGDTTWISDLKAGAEFVQAKHATLNTSGITPTEYKVLIRPKEVEEVTKGGIILAVETTDKEKWATDRQVAARLHLRQSRGMGRCQCCAARDRQARSLRQILRCPAQGQGRRRVRHRQ